MIGVCLPMQPMSSQKPQSRKKKTQTFAQLLNFSKIVLIGKSCYFDYIACSRCELHFLLCSINLDVLRVQRIIGFFYLKLPTNQQGWKIWSHGCIFKLHIQTTQYPFNQTIYLIHTIYPNLASKPHNMQDWTEYSIQLKTILISAKASLLTTQEWKGRIQYHVSTHNISYKCNTIISPQNWYFPQKIDIFYNRNGISYSCFPQGRHKITCRQIVCQFHNL